MIAQQSVSKYLMMDRMMGMWEATILLMRYLKILMICYYSKAFSIPNVIVGLYDAGAVDDDVIVVVLLPDYKEYVVVVV